MPADHPDPQIIDFGEAVFDGDGNKLGTVRGFDEEGVYVTVLKGMGALSSGHQHPGPGFGEAELLWRCSDCGEVGQIETFPERCPSCGAPRERLYYGIED